MGPEPIPRVFATNLFNEWTGRSATGESFTMQHFMTWVVQGLGFRAASKELDMKLP